MLQHLQLFIHRARVSALIDRIVSRSHGAIWRRVRDRAPVMAPNVARGYIRARAALVIEREIGIATSEAPELAEVHWNVIASEATQRLVRRTLADAMRLREATEFQLRRAA